MKDDIKNAISIAVNFHSGQYRKVEYNKVKIPYVIHVLQVYTKLLRWGISDTNILVAAICHDLLEDTGIDKEYLKKEIGDSAYNIVLELTFDKSTGSKEDYLKSFNKNSISSLIIKLADRICNVSDFLESDKEYALKYYHKADELYAAFFNRSDELKALSDFTYSAMMSALTDIRCRVEEENGIFR